MKLEVNVAEDAIAMYLDSIRPEWRDDANLRDTPRRWAEAMDELLAYDPMLIDAELSSIFPTDSDALVAMTDIRCSSVCPHHLLGISYRIDIAYVPRKKAVGASKMARLATLCCKKLDIQENICREIADILDERLQPRGVMVLMKGIHGCIAHRGVKQWDTKLVTSTVKGCFRDPSELARTEFLTLVSGNGHV